jgi:hypothetical protein
MVCRGFAISKAALAGGVPARAWQLELNSADGGHEEADCVAPLLQQWCLLAFHPRTCRFEVHSRRFDGVRHVALVGREESLVLAVSPLPQSVGLVGQHNWQLHHSRCGFESNCVMSGGRCNAHSLTRQDRKGAEKYRVVRRVHTRTFAVGLTLRILVLADGFLQLSLKLRLVDRSLFFQGRVGRTQPMLKFRHPDPLSAICAVAP